LCCLAAPSRYHLRYIGTRTLSPKSLGPRQGRASRTDTTLTNKIAPASEPGDGPAGEPPATLAAAIARSARRYTPSLHDRPPNPKRGRFTRRQWVDSQPACPSSPAGCDGADTRSVALNVGCGLASCSRCGGGVPMRNV
jgi:hypothetical protein